MEDDLEAVGFVARVEEDDAVFQPRRADMRHIVHENAYRTMGPDELQAMFGARMPPDDYVGGMRAFCARSGLKIMTLERRPKFRLHLVAKK